MPVCLQGHDASARTVSHCDVLVNCDGGVCRQVNLFGGVIEPGLALPVHQRLFYLLGQKRLTLTA